MILRVGNYRLVPYQSGQCWQMERWDDGGKEIKRGKHAGKVTRAMWRDISKYPNTIAQGLGYIREYVIREADGEYDLDEALIRIERLFRELDVRVEEKREGFAPRPE